LGYSIGEWDWKDQVLNPISRFTERGFNRILWPVTEEIIGPLQQELPDLTQAL